MRVVSFFLMVAIAYGHALRAQAAVHRMPHTDTSHARTTTTANALGVSPTKQSSESRVRRPAMLWGMLLGTAAGTAAGLWLATYDDDKCAIASGDPCDAVFRANHHRQVSTVLFSAGSGALIGTAVGFLWPHRH
jgi:hypothetical protein